MEADVGVISASVVGSGSVGDLGTGRGLGRTRTLVPGPVPAACVGAPRRRTGLGTVRVGGDGASFLVGRFAGFAARRIVLVGAAGIPVGRRALLRGRTGLLGVGAAAGVVVIAIIAPSAAIVLLSEGG